MHRSGTSMLTGSLQQAGLVLGEVVTEAPHNAKGNREYPAILHMQEELLVASGGSWDRPPAEVRWGVAAPRRARPLHRALPDEPLWGSGSAHAADARGVAQALPSAEFAGIFRHPALVARSLRRRTGLDMDTGLELWRVYNTRLLELHRRHAFPLMEFTTTPRKFGGRWRR
ncbi:MAG: hypothetical protein R2712_10225 [Vicinamibacterales bacterium]